MSGSLSPVVTSALWIVESLFILGAAAWLLRRRLALLPMLLGRDTSALSPSTHPPSNLALAFGFSFGGAFICALALSVVSPWPVPPVGEVNTFTAVSAVVFQTGLFAGLAHAWFWHLRKTPQPPPPTLPAGRILRGAFVTFILLVFAVGGSATLWDALLGLFGVDARPQDIVTLFARRGDAREITIVLLSAVLLAPFSEEILFRVLLFRWLRTRSSRAVVLLLPAALFAFVHGSVAVFVPLAVLSLILALAYERAGHPAVPILAHAFFNLNTIVVVLAGLPA
mgnify:CR=1 FL=1